MYVPKKYSLEFSIPILVGETVWPKQKREILGVFYWQLGETISQLK